MHIHMCTCTMRMCMCACACAMCRCPSLAPAHVHIISYMYRVALSHYPPTGTLRHTVRERRRRGGHDEHEETFGTQCVGKLRSTTLSVRVVLHSEFCHGDYLSEAHHLAQRPISHSRTTSGQRAARTTASSSTEAVCAARHFTTSSVASSLQGRTISGPKAPALPASA